MNQFGEVTVFNQSTRTAQEAAKALNCDLGQIAKSIIFKSKSGKPVLVIASGRNRVEEKIISEILQEEVNKAEADFVKDKTGSVIGGVPPYGHKEKIMTFIDEDLKKFERIWAAAGKPNAVFKLTFEELKERSGGKVVVISSSK